MARDNHKKNLVWRSIKDYDIDKNGFLQANELESCFREHFAPELDGKSLIYYFRKYSTDHDKELINYRMIKESIEAKVAEYVPPTTESKRMSGTVQAETIDEIDLKKTTLLPMNIEEKLAKIGLNQGAMQL